MSTDAWEDDDGYEYEEPLHDNCHWCGTCWGYCRECDEQEERTLI